MLQSQGHDKNFQFALARIGGREQENQWLELPNPTDAAGVSLNANGDYKVSAPPGPRYNQCQPPFGMCQEGRVGAGGGVDSRDAVAKPTGMYSRRPPPDTTQP